MFELSQRSLGNLEGVDSRLVCVTKRAIEVTTVDFGVIEGLRTIEKQSEYVASGASQTMKSKHLAGEAVDLMAYIGPRASWELNVYDNIADAMKIAAIQWDVPIRWGCAWHIHDIRLWAGSMEEAMFNYIDLRRKNGKRPYLDGPHFEIGEVK
tara:strand:- start:2661 stop:3119 length:459 start_codon:yes stop_codon:yes gene_type:complete